MAAAKPFGPEPTTTPSYSLLRIKALLYLMLTGLSAGMYHSGRVVCLSSWLNGRKEETAGSRGQGD